MAVGEVHPPEPEVELRAEELGRRRRLRVVLGEELVAQVGDGCGRLVMRVVIRGPFGRGCNLTVWSSLRIFGPRLARAWVMSRSLPIREDRRATARGTADRGRRAPSRARSQSCGPAAPAAGGAARRHRVAARNARLAAARRPVGRGVRGASGPPAITPAERAPRSTTRTRLRTTAQVVETLGHMKGALMKIGQMASYLDDGMPEPMQAARVAPTGRAADGAGAVARSRARRARRRRPNRVRGVGPGAGRGRVDRPGAPRAYA